jgi:uncharacterized integral membrane protein
LQRILRWVIGLPLALVVIVFAISNRQRVALRFDPFTSGETSYSIEMPLWLLFFFGITAGVIVGWIGSWLAQGKHRKRVRELQGDVTRLQAERQQLMSRAEVAAPSAEPQRREIIPSEAGWI